MNKNAIKKYAIWARNELIDRVSKKALRYGITPNSKADPKADSVNGELLTESERKQRSALIKKIASHGYEQTMEEVAYTWFNRFAALRFMEVNGYLPSHVRVFTNDAGEFKPQILAEAIHLDMPGLDMDKVYALKEANNTEELYRYLIIVQCNALSEILPGMFQRLEDFTELLLPDNLLREGSVIERLVKQGESDSIPEEDWRDQVQIIGWLYQYYNTEPKDKVFADLKKNIKVSKEKIPAATQLFTPDWIVRYMVENSLGRLWLEGHPNDTLRADWKYYLDEAEQEPEVQKQLDEIRKEYAALKPEDIRCIDPCMGSGHILCYLFDVLVKIYETYGYTAREAVGKIIENNLYGLDIDDRAAQLAYFSVMMKARQYDRRFFSRHLQPRVLAIQESNGLKTWSEVAGDSLVSEQLNFDDRFIQMADYLIDTFRDAKEYGSILQVNDDDYDGLLGFIERVKQEDGNLLFRAWIDEIERGIVPLVEQAKWLTQKYEVVVTNPPYMGSSNMSVGLSAFVKKNYPDSKSDLFACLIERCGEMARVNGYVGTITQHAWMFLSSFENLRKKLLKKDIVNMAHLGARAFEEIGGEVVQTTSMVTSNAHIDGYKGIFVRLVEPTTQAGKEEMFLNGENRFATCQENFSKIPGAPVAYWAGDHIWKLFDKYPLLATVANAKQGSTLGDNEQFLRMWFEIVDRKDKWFPCMKGGNYRRWYGNMNYLVNWENKGEAVKATGRATIRSENLLFKEGLTWSNITSSQASFRYMPEGFFFESSGTVCFIEKLWLGYLIAFLNTPIVKSINSMINPTLHLQSGDVAKLPFIQNSEQHSLVDKLTKENISLSKTDWDSFETSWDFERHPLVTPQEVSCDIKVSKSEAVEEKKILALKYYTVHGASLGYCAQIAGMGKEDFIRYLSANKVSIFQFDDKDEFIEEMKNA